MARLRVHYAGQTWEQPKFAIYAEFDPRSNDTQISAAYNSREEAEEVRRLIYSIISQELQDAAKEFDNKSYEEASKFLDAKYSI